LSFAKIALAKALTILAVLALVPWINPDIAQGTTSSALSTIASVSAERNEVILSPL
jgi:hypothetical protein